jgi:glyoxylase-like metal-dependent hydrolase (beta-lactamase superfamily II)
MIRITSFFDERTWTFTHVVNDRESGDAVIIDPVLDFEPAGGRVFQESAKRVMAHVEAHSLRVHYLLETHAHADHLSGADVLRRRLPGARTAVSRRVVEVQEVFKKVFDLPADFPVDGSQFDRLLDDGEVLEAGSLHVEVLHTPGHTPACASYKIEDAVFTGDALFMPDQGVGRCDFPAGDARAMYASVTSRFYGLPDATRVFVGHDYRPGGRPEACETTIGEERRKNVALNAETNREAFVEFREKRDAELGAPRLLYPSLQVNIRAGRLPASGPGGGRFLRIPLNVEG